MSFQINSDVGHLYIQSLNWTHRDETDPFVTCNSGEEREHEALLKCQIVPLTFTLIAVNLKCGASMAATETQTGLFDSGCVEVCRVWRNSKRYPLTFTLSHDRGVTGE